MKTGRLCCILCAALLALTACNREYNENRITGAWEVQKGSVAIALMDGTVIQGSTLNALEAQLIAYLSPTLERIIPGADTRKLQERIYKAKAIPLIRPDRYRIEFKDDETYVFSRKQMDVWETAETGDYSYAQGKLVLFRDQGAVQCTIEKLTNRRLIGNFPLELPTLSGCTKDDEIGEEGIPPFSALLALLRGIRYSTDLEMRKL